MRSGLIALSLLVFGTIAQATDWPAWRGPTGQGFCDEKNLPLKWSDKENVKWKIALENQGNSTPIVWGDKIFVTQANKGGSVRSLFCFARSNGKQQWRVDVNYDQKEKNWNESWYCNASAVTDGERVVACFGSAGLYCYDFNGKEQWKRTDLGRWEHQFGNGASPVLYGDLVIMWCGPNNGKDRNFLIGVNKKDGKTVWEKDEKFGSWGTPVIVKANEADQMLLGTSDDVKGQPDEKTGFLKGYDPKTGKELWSSHGLDSFVYTSALYGNGVAVGMSGYGGSSMAVKLGGTGNITKDRLWKHPKPANQRVGSGMIVGDYVYMVDDNATVHCYDLITGDDKWKEVARLSGGPTWGSMVHADGKLYILMRNCQTHVLAANPKYDLMATNSLGGGEQTNSSIVISNGEIFIRTFKNLWCISDKK